MNVSVSEKLAGLEKLMGSIIFLGENDFVLCCPTQTDHSDCYIPFQDICL